MAISEISVRDLVGDTSALIDVREPDEYAAGHIPGAVNIPLSELPSRVNDCLVSSVVRVVCQSGGRSMRACEFLSQQAESEGATFVNVAGGTKAWIAEGFEVALGESPL